MVGRLTVFLRSSRALLMDCGVYFIFFGILFELVIYSLSPNLLTYSQVTTPHIQLRGVLSL